MFPGMKLPRVDLATDRFCQKSVAALFTATAGGSRRHDISSQNGRSKVIGQETRYIDLSQPEAEHKRTEQIQFAILVRQAVPSEIEVCYQPQHSVTRGRET